ncbi:MAG: hypothetical protein AAFV90_01820 [Cyanobacteria bacterium J06634_5]
MIDASLEKLVQLVQQDASLEAQIAAQKEVVKMLLRSRKVGRSPIGVPLTGIYQVIYERLSQQLHTELASGLQSYELTDPTRWVSGLLHQATQSTLTDDLLKALALEAQSHPPSSVLRQHALVQLVEAIRLSGRLARPHRTKFSPPFYALLYEDAVNQTLAYVCRRIDTYDPNRGKARKFMNWVNFRLDRKVIDCRRAFSDRNTQSLPNLNDLDALPQPEPAESLADTVRAYIQADPEQIFQQAHIRKRPDANFQVIAIARFSDKSWEDISSDLGIKIPTLSSFFQRCCHKFSAQFQTLL